MRITGLKTFVANVSRTNFVFVKLYTDDGIDGVGEATLEWKTLAVVAGLEELERQLVGRDPFRSDALVEQFHRDSYWRTGAVFRTALGAVEAAMLDIKGKALGVPVFELLGGKYRDKVACYANHWFFGARTPEEYHTAATRGVAMGYRALKWDPFEASDLDMDRAQRNRTIAIVEAVRDAVGSDIELMLDVHGRLNVPTAIALCKKAVDILQPDVSHAGGLAETKRIAHLAHLHLIPVAPHNPVGPVMNAMTLHTALAIPNFSVLETVSVDVPWRKELVDETLVFEDGHLLAPTAPGLGVELHEEAFARFPYAPHDLPLFDGSINVSGVATGAVVMNERQL